MLHLQHRDQLALEQQSGIVEVLAHLLGKGLGLGGDDVEEVADRDDAPEGEGLALLDQQHQHDLERRALALQRRGERHQRLHQGRAEGIEGARGPCDPHRWPVH